MKNYLKNKISEMRDYRIIQRSGLFDHSYYLRTYLDVARSCMNPVKHYLRHGWLEGRNPCELFDTQWYLKTYPDVKKSGMNPFCHFIQYGLIEGRKTAGNAQEAQTASPIPKREHESASVFRDSVRESFFQSCKSLTLIIDHDLGGGANHYRNQLIANLTAESEDVLLLTNIVNYGKQTGYKLTLCPGKEQKKIELKSSQDLFLLLENAPVRRVIYNSLVYYAELELFLKKLTAWSRAGVETTIAIHDFFPVCPSFNLINGRGEYCGLVSISHCASCLKSLSLEYMSKPVDMLMYKRLWQDVLTAASAILCFSQTSADLLKKAYPLLDRNKFRILPHSMDYFKTSRIDIKKPRSGPLKIGIAGDIFSVAKGSRFVARFSDYLFTQDPDARIYIFGRYDGAGKNVVHVGSYKPDELAGLLAKHEIDVVFIPSIWPETFSYLTSELIMIGVPVVCFDFGAQAEKVRQYEYGAVVPEVSEQKVYDAIIRLYKQVY